MSAPQYPGRIIQFGEPDQAVVTTVQKRLVERGCGPLTLSGLFDAKTRSAVKLFQARFPDKTGVPLVVDGEVGSLTWEVLFGEGSVATAAGPPDRLLGEALGVAAGELGVLEEPPGSDRGPRVDEYLRTVGLNPSEGSFAWCAAFVYWCFEQAARAEGRSNPVIRTAGVLDHWRMAESAGIRRLAGADAAEDPGLVHPGMIFVLDFGGGAGHTGLVEGVQDGRLVAPEGNTNDDGSREGVGVFRRTGRKIVSINRGLIDYAGR